MTDIIIIGGGIAGLSAAYYSLKKAPEARVTLLEAGDRWGGKITTERVAFDDGQFIIEGGPDTFLATKPYATALCKELGLDGRLQGTNPQHKNTYVLHRGRLLPLPDGLAMMIPTNISSVLRSGLLGWPAKLRMGLDFLLPAHPRISRAGAPSGDESLGGFISRRLGRAAYENLIEPLMSGIYAGDGDELSLQSTFPFLRDLELNYGSLVRGALQMRRKSALNGKPAQGSRSVFLTPAGGLAEVVEVLVTRLQQDNARMCLNTPVARIAHQADRYLAGLADGSVLEADAVILATPAHVSATLLASLDPALAADLQAIPYASTATISLAYRQVDLPRKLDGYGYVIPRREGRRALACTWTSTKFPHRAPEGYALMRVFVGRAGQSIPWNEPALLSVAREELALTLGITAEPLLSRVFMWDRAMPQYNLGHPERLASIDAALEKQPGLALAGNGYRGIGIPDCIHSGELAAAKVLEKIEQKTESKEDRAHSHVTVLAGTV
jgi:oxygen-dependent protoporphyrinogen oxidase